MATVFQKSQRLSLFTGDSMAAFLPLALLVLIAAPTKVLATGANSSSAEEGSSQLTEVSDLEAIKACIQSNAPQDTVKQSASLTSFDRGGGSRELDVRLYARQHRELDQVMMYIAAPADLKGVRYLLLENTNRDDMFMFLPGLNRVRRLTGKQVTDSALFGTDFSYEDIKQLSGSFSRGDVSLLGAEKYEGRDVFRLSLKPDPDKESAYSEVLSLVDWQSCTVLLTEFSAGDLGTVKRLTGNPESLMYSEADKRWLLAEQRMDNLQAGTYTVLIVKDSEFDIKLPSRIFNPKTFSKAR